MGQSTSRPSSVWFALGFGLKDEPSSQTATAPGEYGWSGAGPRPQAVHGKGGVANQTLRPIFLSVAGPKTRVSKRQKFCDAFLNPSVLTRSDTRPYNPGTDALPPLCE